METAKLAKRTRLFQAHVRAGLNVLVALSDAVETHRHSTRESHCLCRYAARRQRDKVQLLPKCSQHRVLGEARGLLETSDAMKVVGWL